MSQPHSNNSTARPQRATPFNLHMFKCGHELLQYHGAQCQGHESRCKVTCTPRRHPLAQHLSLHECDHCVFLSGQEAVVRGSRKPARAPVHVPRGPCLECETEIDNPFCGNFKERRRAIAKGAK